MERRQLGRSREPLLGSEIAATAGNFTGEFPGVSRLCDFQDVQERQRPIRIDLRMGRLLLLNINYGLCGKPLARKQRQQAITRAGSFSGRSRSFLGRAGRGRFFRIGLVPADREAEQSFRGNLSGRRKSRHAAERSFAAEGHAIGDSELCQQGRNVEFHSAFRHVEFRGDFLVREALENAVQHFLLAPAYLHARSKGAPRGQKLLSAFGDGVQQRHPGNNHQFVIFGRLAPHQAMYGEQTCNFFHRHGAIGICFDAETHRAGGTLAQDITLWRKW